MEITQITFIVSYDSIEPLLFAALKTDKCSFTKFIFALNAFGSFSLAFVTQITLTFVFQIISSSFFSTRTCNIL